jgi:hypothetical protein
MYSSLKGFSHKKIMSHWIIEAVIYKFFTIVSIRKYPWILVLLSDRFLKLVRDDPIEKQTAQEQLVLYLTVSSNLTIPQTNRQPYYHLEM